MIAYYRALGTEYW